MFTEDDLLPISALQHLLFCERQWALIHLEGQWTENRLTTEGRHLHERVDTLGVESRGDRRTARSLHLRSLRLGLTGRADAVEFHRLDPEEAAFAALPGEKAQAVRLPGVSGLWRPMPVEYKRGKPKKNRCDDVQLCAQGLCLEEMLQVDIPAGALFYGKTRRRTVVPFDDELRHLTETTIARLHELTGQRDTPRVRYTKKCDRCSLYATCLPKTTGGRRSARGYVARAVADILAARPGENS